MGRLMAAGVFGLLCLVVRSRSISFDGYALLDTVQRGVYWDPAHPLMPLFFRLFGLIAGIFDGDAAFGAQMFSAASGGVCAWCLLPNEQFRKSWWHPRTLAAGLFLGLPVVSSQFTGIEVYGPALAALFAAHSAAEKLFHRRTRTRCAIFRLLLILMVGTHIVMVLALPFLVRTAGGFVRDDGVINRRNRLVVWLGILAVVVTAISLRGPEILEFFHRMETFVRLRLSDGVLAALGLRLSNLRDLVLVDAPLLFAALFCASGLARFEGPISLRRLELCLWFGAAYLVLGVPVTALLLPVAAGAALFAGEYLDRIRSRRIVLGILMILSLGQGVLSFRGHYDLSRREDPLGVDLVRLSEGLAGPIAVVSGEWCYHWRKFTSWPAVAVNEWTFAAQTRGEEGLIAWAAVQRWVRGQQAGGRTVYLDYSGYRSLGVVGLPVAEMDRVLDLSRARVVRDVPPIGMVPFRDL